MCVCVFSGRQLAQHRTKSCRGRWSSWRDATCTTTFVINYPLIDKKMWIHSRKWWVTVIESTVSWFRAHADSVLDTTLFPAAEGAVFFLSSLCFLSGFSNNIWAASHQSDAVLFCCLGFLNVTHVKISVVFVGFQIWGIYQSPLVSPHLPGN